jgi:hypothetical protein
VLFIAVNADPNPLDVGFEGLGAFRTLECLFESRTPAFNGGKFRDTLEPFDARVYRLRK